MLAGNLHGAVQRCHPGGIDFVNDHAQSVIPDVNVELVADARNGSEERGNRGVVSHAELPGQIIRQAKFFDQAQLGFEVVHVAFFVA